MLDAVQLHRPRHREIAFQLGKRYVQDQPLAWGAATDAKAEDLDRMQSYSDYGADDAAPAEESFDIF